jgi:hypothetical protein
MTRSAQATAPRSLPRHTEAAVVAFDAAGLVSTLATHVPAVRRGAFDVEACAIAEVIAGRRGTLFALVDVSFIAAATGHRSTRRLVVQRFADARTAPEEGRKVLRRLRRRAGTPGLAEEIREWAALVPDEAALVVPFPFDYRMPTLVQACDAAVAGSRLAGLLSRPRVQCHVTPVRYVPHKRCQLRYDLTEPDGTTAAVFGKVRSRGPGAREFEWMQTLHESMRASGLAGTPAPVGRLPDWGMVVQRAVPGRTLYELQRSQSEDASMYDATGRALALFHATPVRDLPPYTPHDELALLGAVLGKSWLRPDGRRLARQALEWLMRTVDLVEQSPVVTAHRDFYDKQILAGSEGVWIIDLDTLACAPPALDVGNFIAHLRLRERQGYLSYARARACATGFLEGYTRCRAVDDAAIDWCVAAALLRLAAIYVIRPAWSHLADALVEDAAACLPVPQTPHARAAASRHPSTT